MIRAPPAQRRAFVEIAEYTYNHVQGLSMQWHLKKKMGNVIRSMDRGADAANQLVNWLFLYLLPALAECASVCVIFLAAYDNWPMALVASTNCRARPRYLAALQTTEELCCCRNCHARGEARCSGRSSFA